MSYYVLYYLEVKPEKVQVFESAWKTLSSEVQAVFPGSGTTLYRTESDMYTCVSKWRVEEEWQLFWQTKEQRFENFKVINACLKRPMQAKALDPVQSNFHTMEYTDNQLTITKVA